MIQGQRMKLPTLNRSCAHRALFGLALTVTPLAASAGGFLGIDTRVGGQATGIWSRTNQQILQDVTPLVVVGLALWEGDNSRLGHASWQSVDSLVIGTVTSEAMKRIFSRARPTQTDDPNQWFKGSGHRSFPSGEVMEITTAITPYVLEYGKDHPAVYALELLPLYDGIARVKSHAHWQTDVLASFVIGTGIGYYSHSRNVPISVQLLPHGVTVGWKMTF
jgi:membrane-associated phospholipid phosphatase